MQFGRSNRESKGFPSAPKGLPSEMKRLACGAQVVLEWALVGFEVARGAASCDGARTRG
jgi:hypothetical protein